MDTIHVKGSKASKKKNKKKGKIKYEIPPEAAADMQAASSQSETGANASQQPTVDKPPQPQRDDINDETGRTEGEPSGPENAPTMPKEPQELVSPVAAVPLDDTSIAIQPRSGNSQEGVVEHIPEKENGRSEQPEGGVQPSAPASEPYRDLDDPRTRRMFMRKVYWAIAGQQAFFASTFALFVYVYVTGFVQPNSTKCIILT